MSQADWEYEAERLRLALARRFPGLPEGASPVAPVPEADHRGSDRHSVLQLVRKDLRPALFDYQSDLSRQIIGVARARGRGLVSLPTGAGKTRTAVNAILDAFQTRVISRAIWLAPTVELVDQAFRTFESLWRSHGGAPDMTLTRDFVDSAEATVWLATPQSIYSRMRRQRMLGHWDLVVFDEAHQLGARTFRAAVEELTKPGAAGPAALVGLSATPGRAESSETEDLVSMFGGSLLTSARLRPNPVKVLQRRGVLARLRFRSLTARAIDPADEAERLEIVMRAALALSGKGRRVLVFSASVAGAVVLSELLRASDVRAAAVHAGMGMEARFESIDAFSSGHIQVLTNQRLLATGYDCPAISDVIVAYPVRSPILFEQIVGRAARGPRTGGSAESNVWEFDSHLDMHGLPQSYYRFRHYDWTAVGD